MRAGSPGILVIESGWITKAYQCNRCGDDSQSDAGLTLIRCASRLDRMAPRLRRAIARRASRAMRLPR